MKVPFICRNCAGENWVDMDDLTEWPLDRLITAQGYKCSQCEVLEAISYTSRSMQDAERKLSRYAPAHPKFRLLVDKLVRKQRGLNERGEAYGKSNHPDMAFA